MTKHYYLTLDNDHLGLWPVSLTLQAKKLASLGAVVSMDYDVIRGYVTSWWDRYYSTGLRPWGCGISTHMSSQLAFVPHARSDYMDESLLTIGKQPKIKHTILYSATCTCHWTYGPTLQTDILKTCDHHGQLHKFWAAGAKCDCGWEALMDTGSAPSDSIVRDVVLLGKEHRREVKEAHHLKTVPTSA